MNRPRPKLVLAALAAAAVLAVIAFAIRPPSIQAVGRLSQRDMIQIQEEVRRRQWQEIFPDHSWRSFCGLPSNLLRLGFSHRRVCATNLRGDLAGVGTWAGSDQTNGFMDIDWLEKRGRDWKLVRRTRNVRRSDWLTVTNLPPTFDFPQPILLNPIR